MRTNLYLRDVILGGGKDGYEGKHRNLNLGAESARNLSCGGGGRSG